MGANFDFRYVLDKPYTKNELERVFWSIVRDSLAKHGYDGYTGTIAEAHGLNITDKVFSERDEALKYIEGAAQKWGHALAVKVVKGESTIWVIGGTFPN